MGEGVEDIKVGDNVAYSSKSIVYFETDTYAVMLTNSFLYPDIGAFSEYLEVPASKIIKSPELSPALVPSRSVACQLPSPWTRLAR